GARLGGASEQETVEGGKHALSGHFAVARDGIGGAGDLDPKPWILGRERESALEGMEGALVIAGKHGLPALVEQCVVAKALLVFAKAEACALLAGVFHQLVGYEVGPLGCVDIRFRAPLDDASGNGTG